jgi:hypothetical protein
MMKFSSFKNKHSVSETKILSLGDTRTRIGPKMRSPRLRLTERAPKSPPKHRARHWATPTCHSSQKTLQFCTHINKHKQILSN